MTGQFVFNKHLILPTKLKFCVVFLISWLAKSTCICSFISLGWWSEKYVVSRQVNIRPTDNSRPVAQNYPKVVIKWSQIYPNVVPKLYQGCLKVTFIKVVQILSQSCLKVEKYAVSRQVKIWPSDTSRPVAQNYPKVVLMLSQSYLKAVQNLSQNRLKVCRQLRSMPCHCRWRSDHLILYAGGSKLSQSCPNAVPKLSQGCSKFISKSSQSLSTAEKYAVSLQVKIRPSDTSRRWLKTIPKLSLCCPKVISQLFESCLKVVPCWEVCRVTAGEDPTIRYFTPVGISWTPARQIVLHVDLPSGSASSSVVVLCLAQSSAQTVARCATMLVAQYWTIWHKICAFLWTLWIWLCLFLCCVLCCTICCTKCCTMCHFSSRIVLNYMAQDSIGLNVCVAFDIAFVLYLLNPVNLTLHNPTFLCNSHARV